MPKLWTDTVEEHRRAVRDAALDAAAKLVAAHGLASVTMSKIAAETGIGRATLYGTFPTSSRSSSPGTSARSAPTWRS